MLLLREIISKLKWPIGLSISFGLGSLYSVRKELENILAELVEKTGGNSSASSATVKEFADRLLKFFGVYRRR